MDSTERKAVNEMLAKNEDLVEMNIKVLEALKAIKAIVIEIVDSTIKQATDRVQNKTTHSIEE